MFTSLAEKLKISRLGLLVSEWDRSVSIEFMAIRLWSDCAWQEMLAALIVGASDEFQESEHWLDETFLSASL